MKQFLYPKAFRRGSPILIFVAKDGKKYWLGTYHELREIQPKSEKKYSGAGREYNAVQRIRISKELYRAFMEEAKINHEKYSKEDDAIKAIPKLEAAGF
jgi:hypothetical protein